MFGQNLLFAAICIGIGAIGTLTIEHGWGWVRARWAAYKAVAEAKASDTYTEIASQVRAATQGLSGDVEKLKADMAAVKAKVGA